jgi:ribonuclease HII
MIDSYYSAGKLVGFIDEVGRGSLAGALYTCCVVFKDNTFYDCTINDSKQINKENMGTLANLVKLNALEYKLGIVTVDEINEMRNINKVQFLAMERAVTALKNKPDVLFLDGIYKINVPIEQVTVIKGDSKIFGIACASIVAKDARDEYMKTLHAAEPYYGWTSNAGYGCQKHKDGIKDHGLSKHHRTYYKGVLDK